MGNYSCLLWVLLFVEGISSDTKTKEVTVGDNVTLEGFPGVTSEDQILWKFNNSIIVNVEEAAGTNYFSEDENFKNRLKLDKQNGSLTITDTKSIHGGTYQLEINGNKETKPRTFRVTVHDVESESKIEGDSFSLPIDVNEQRDNQILWKFNGQVIPTDGDLKGSMWRNIVMNKDTGEFSFREIQINQTGTYDVEIKSTNFSLHRKFSVTVAQSGAPSGICGAGVGLVVWAVAVFLLQEV